MSVALSDRIKHKANKKLNLLSAIFINITPFKGYYTLQMPLKHHDFLSMVKRKKRKSWKVKRFTSDANPTADQHRISPSITMITALLSLKVFLLTSTLSLLVVKTRPHTLAPRGMNFRIP